MTPLNRKAVLYIVIQPLASCCDIILMRALQDLTDSAVCVNTVQYLNKAACTTQGVWTEAHCTGNEYTSKAACVTPGTWTHGNCSINDGGRENSFSDCTGDPGIWTPFDKYSCDINGRGREISEQKCLNSSHNTWTKGSCSNPSDFDHIVVENGFECNSLKMDNTSVSFTDFIQSECLNAATIRAGYSSSTLDTSPSINKPKGCYVHQGTSYEDGNYAWNVAGYNSVAGTQGRDDFVTICKKISDEICSGTWTAGYCSNPDYVTEEACLSTGTSWEVGYCSINSGGRQKSPLLCEADVGEWQNSIKEFNDNTCTNGVCGSCSKSNFTTEEACITKGTWIYGECNKNQYKTEAACLNQGTWSKGYCENHIFRSTSLGCPYGSFP